MKRQILPIIFLTMLVFFLTSASVLCDEIEKNSQLIKYYDSFIEEKISKCHSKAQLRNSKSTNLQKCASLEIKKANYFVEYKELLIHEMVKSNIGLKEYKIEYFLNTKFYENNGVNQTKK